MIILSLGLRLRAGADDRVSFKEFDGIIQRNGQPTQGRGKERGPHGRGRARATPTCGLLQQRRSSGSGSDESPALPVAG